MDNPVLWTLIAVQVAMGAFDTLYHHEGTERLAWRASQKNELRLHGVRNIFYAAIFVCFGWFEPHGAFTIALALILGVEVLITLWDFVEEDLTRKLPASERINHTLLALNYGRHTGPGGTPSLRLGPARNRHCADQLRLVERFCQPVCVGRVHFRYPRLSWRLRVVTGCCRRPRSIS